MLAARAIDHGHMIALGTKDELVHSTFGSRRQVLARFENAGDGVAAWVKQLGGIYDGGAAQFTIEHVSEIAGLLVAASGAGYELADVSLRKLNLESVFLLCVRV